MINPLYYLAREIAPPECLVCGREGWIVCRGCLPSLQATPAAQDCIGCGVASPIGRTCTVCRPVTGLDGLTAASVYADAPKQLIHALKYYRQRDAGVVLGLMIALRLPVTGFDVVAAVPVATPRLRQRGYNQAELIARTVAAELRLPYRRLLWRARTTQQVGKTRAERLAAVEGIYGVRGDVKAKSVLLIDDVCTTGATLNACAMALHMDGAKSVWGGVAARD